MDERIWNDQPISLGETITLPGVTITRKRIEYTTLISGNFNAALKKHAPGVKAVGLGEDIVTSDHAIRLGRDIVVLSTKMPPDIAPGWYEGGYAVSRADEKYAVLEIFGDGAEDLIAQGAGIKFKHPSLSAAIQFSGLTCLLVRQNKAWLLFVERPLLTYVSEFFRGSATLDLE